MPGAELPVAMTEDATQGNWQPLADQPILPDDPPAPADEMVWARPPDDGSWARPPDDAVGGTQHDAAPAQQRFEQPPAPYGQPAGYAAPGQPASATRAADYLESSPPRRPPIVGIAGLAIVAVLILAGLGFAVRDGNRSATSAGTVASRSATPLVGSLDGYLLSPADVGAGTSMSLVPGGRSLSGAGGVTLDFCDRQFASEKSRAQRVQAQYVGPAGAASNEVVRYRPGGAAAAFAEIEKAVTTCGSGYSDAAGTISHLQQPTGFSGLTAQHVVVSFEHTVNQAGSARSFWVTCAYQFDGDYFRGVRLQRRAVHRASVRRAAGEEGSGAPKRSGQRRSRDRRRHLPHGRTGRRRRAAGMSRSDR